MELERNRTASPRPLLAPRRDGSPPLYWIFDSAIGYTVFTILIFTPWMFGTTEHWAIRTVNTWNFFLGGLMVCKWLVRLFTGFKPARWDGSDAYRGVHPAWFLAPIGLLTIFLLAYTGVSAWNARAYFIADEQRFEYLPDFIKWLPHSYDREASWQAFQQYLAVAFFFWALRDWLSAKSHRESRLDIDIEGRAAIGPDSAEMAGAYTYDPTRFPSRLKRLLWVICVNGAALAVQGTLQRLYKSNELLWTVHPALNELYWEQFGPFAYRSNGAQYLNMIWPVGLAFWWSLNQQRSKKFGEGAEFLLLPFTALMLAAPFIAGSRGGLSVAAAQILSVIGIFAYSYRRGGWWKTGLVALLLASIAISSSTLGWKGLQSRLSENTFNTFEARKEIYENSRQIVEEFSTWGSGPGSFANIYQLYRQGLNQPWYHAAHDDYLQTVITFGRVGFTAILFVLALVFGYWFLARGIPTSELFVAFIWVAAAGCLMHARFDFPFQVYSILLLFVTLCAILTTLARRS